jgi:hypothetical protein
MAVITVSKIQVRSGLQEDLPTLDTAEFGWCVDTQRLFIGKGTLAEGAPVTGVTEILTEYSIALLNYNIAQFESNIAIFDDNVANLLAVTGNLQPKTVQVFDNQSSITNIGNVTINSLSSQIINYNITRSTSNRVGTIRVTNYSGTTIAFEDNYSETATTGVSLYFTGNTITGNAVLGYTTTSTGSDGNLTYSFTDLRTIV